MRRVLCFLMYGRQHQLPAPWRFVRGTRRTCPCCRREFLAVCRDKSLVWELASKHDCRPWLPRADKLEAGERAQCRACGQWNERHDYDEDDPVSGLTVWRCGWRRVGR